jgi:hypothetical protein
VAEAALTGIGRELSKKTRYPYPALLAVTQQAVAAVSAADTLFAAIGVQLALTVNRGAGLAYCAACGKLYPHGTCIATLRGS